MTVQIILSAYVIFMNVWGFILMGVDKRKARRQAFRIPESTLFLVALLGGSAGEIAGMLLFRHKTRKWRFVAGLPAILILQAALIIFLIFFSPVEIKIM